MRSYPPAPPFEGAVLPPSPPPQPTFFERHPRLRAALSMVFGLFLVVTIARRLESDGFSWFSVTVLVVVSAGVGADITRLSTRPTPRDG